MSLSLHVCARSFQFALQNFLGNLSVRRTSPDFDDVAANLKVTDSQPGVVRIP